MYHLGMDSSRRDVLVWLDFLSLDPLDQSGLGWWFDWILGLGDVCLFVSLPGFRSRSPPNAPGSTT
jgi:hypothetical protein